MASLLTSARTNTSLSESIEDDGVSRSAMSGAASFDDFTDSF